MFFFSKLVTMACQPLSWVLLLLLGGLMAMQRQHRWGKPLCWTALCMLLITGWYLPADTLLHRLEDQYPVLKPDADLTKYAGIVVLGGALESGYIWTTHGQIALTDAAERMVVPVVLLQQNPHLHMLFTGGEGQLFSTGPTEAQRAKIFFDSMGVAPQRVLYESRSRTTYENAIFSADVPGVQTQQPWLLLTSAYHMPRAMATFQKAGWNVTPYPVDFHTSSKQPWLDFSFEIGARKWHLALHELAGLLAYRMTGRA